MVGKIKRISRRILSLVTLSANDITNKFHKWPFFDLLHFFSQIFGSSLFGSSLFGSSRGSFLWSSSSLLLPLAKMTV